MAFGGHTVAQFPEASKATHHFRSPTRAPAPIQDRFLSLFLDTLVGDLVDAFILLHLGDFLRLQLVLKLILFGSANLVEDRRLPCMCLCRDHIGPSPEPSPPLFIYNLRWHYRNKFLAVLLGQLRRELDAPLPGTDLCGLTEPDADPSKAD